MAATDQKYRSPKALDMVFAVSCILMLVSVVGMFAQDYYREFKVVQREFRDIETEVFEREMVANLARVTDKVSIKTLEEAIDKLARARMDIKKLQEDVLSEIKKLRVDLAKQDAELNSLKATFDSLMSLRNIDADEGHPLSANAKKVKLESLGAEIYKLQGDIETTKSKIDEKQQTVRDAEAKKARELYAEQVEAGLAPKADPNDIKTFSHVEDPIKKATTDLDRLAKTAAQKRWKFGDWFRALPVIDGFASPYRIEQYTLEKLPIDYNFKMVTRYDRCHTCHLGMERGTFDRETLTALKDAPDAQQQQLNAIIAFYKNREKSGEKLSFNLGDLPTKIKSIPLTSAQISQFSAHPRLDLFVDSNSPHSGEKFGCTICHAGQGSATAFDVAAHMPNNSVQMKEWSDKHSWHVSHYWDFPMLPHRFIESSCVKCHHQITDLIRYGSRNEAPKLLRGYNLVRENGCFGCHEIAGVKAGKPVGPDLRLEPIPPLDAMTAAEQTKMLADPLNPPGTMRKVGPSLYRLTEKTNEDWTRKWISNPRDFRPDTRMPHFYHLSNNDHEALKDTADKQQDFPTAEIHSIAHYLFRESQSYLSGKDKYRAAKEQRREGLRAKQKNGTISEREQKELIELDSLLDRIKGSVLPPLAERMIDGEGNVVSQLPPPAKGPELVEGARLFREKGCLACHSHDGTRTALDDGRPIPPVTSEADFGPNLTRLAAKIAATMDTQESGRRWLVQWIMNPNVHFPRTRMPITHLTVQEATRLADWLLSQSALAKEWAPADVPAPSSDTLVRLAKVYLAKAPSMTQAKVEEVMTKGFEAKWFQDRDLPLDADERILIGKPGDNELKYYIGRKAINRLGCYGCHDIPGFEIAKPIGTPLNEWGKKDTERLAFEDIKAYVNNHYHRVNLRDDPNDKSKPSSEWKFKDGKAPYEEFFYEALANHQHDQTGRVGFLHQKLEEPRSYDYNRIRTWDDRLRMPQFKFARTKQRGKESDEDYKIRQSREEAEAREAVMTFILGLTAENIPLDYIYNPPPDRRAEVKGRQVLDKFNCGGCHQVRSGVYEFKLTPELKDRLESIHSGVQKRAKSDYAHSFPNDNAWQGQPSPIPNRLVVKAMPRVSKEAGIANYRLTEALRFPGSQDNKPKDIPAGENFSGIPLDALVKGSEPYGGAFTELMVPYAEKRGIPIVGSGMDDRWARSGLPPPLLREGERVQTDWLFQFLRNPGVIRPQQANDGLMFLRMPRFNMSDDDAQALVNYFAAADRISNPGLGLVYPYASVKQREEEYWIKENQKYVNKLGQEALNKKVKDLGLAQFWLEYTQDRVTELERTKLTAAQAREKAALDALAKAKTDKEIADAKKGVDEAKKALASVLEDIRKLKDQIDKKEFPELEKQWKGSQVYATDAYRLLGPKGQCLGCHQLNGVGDTKAIPLDLVPGRLRPEWTVRWLANPERMFAYNPQMPQNFPAHENTLPELFHGTQLEKVSAMRDMLMNLPKESALPPNRYYRLSGGN